MSYKVSKHIGMRVFSLGCAIALLACQTPLAGSDEVSGPVSHISLPKPQSSVIPVVNIAPAVSRPQHYQPKVPQGFKITVYAQNLTHARWLYRLPNGDILVVQSNRQSPRKSWNIREHVTNYVMKRAGAGGESPDKITLLRDKNGDGVVETTSEFLKNLHSPFGVALIDNYLYVANTDAVVRYPYTTGMLQIDTTLSLPEKVVDLPAGDNNGHWTRNLIVSPDKRKLYITVGSSSNIGERGMDNEKDRASILEFDLSSRQVKRFASGLRNPNGLAWDSHGSLWTVVNERDELGDNLVPDYLTHVQENDFFGWPYFYYGKHRDTRVIGELPDTNVVIPDYALGAHVAALGLVFSHKTFSPPFDDGVFISEHGSWNRRVKSGYKVVFVPFIQNKPVGKPIDFVTNFLNHHEEAYGRPVGLIFDNYQGLLVADDVGNCVWRVSVDK